MRVCVLESPPFGKAPLKKAGPAMYPYDILKDLRRPKSKEIEEKKNRQNSK